MRVYYTWQSCFAPENLVRYFIEVDAPAEGCPLDAEDVLHKLWTRHNLHRPFGNVMPSMSVGDIVTLYVRDENNKTVGHAFTPISVGFAELSKLQVNTLKKAMCVDRRSYVCCVSFVDSIEDIITNIRNEFGDRLKRLQVEVPCNTYTEPTNDKEPV